MYKRKSRLRARQQSKLMEHFVVGSTARATAEVVGVQANTAIRFFMHLRQLIASKLPSYRLCGEVEADESYFGGVQKGKRGRGAAGKVAVFDLLKRGGKVYTAIVPNAKTETLLPIIQEKGATRQHRLHGHIQGLQCAQCIRLPPPPHQSLKALRRQSKPHQRDRKLLEPSEAAHAQVQRHQIRQSLLVPEGM